LNWLHPRKVPIDLRNLLLEDIHFILISVNNFDSFDWIRDLSFRPLLRYPKFELRPIHGSTGFLRFCALRAEFCCLNILHRFWLSHFHGLSMRVAAFVTILAMTTFDKEPALALLLILNIWIECSCSIISLNFFLLFVFGLCVIFLLIIIHY